MAEGQLHDGDRFREALVASVPLEKWHDERMESFGIVAGHRVSRAGNRRELTARGGSAPFGGLRGDEIAVGTADHEGRCRQLLERAPHRGLRLSPPRMAREPGGVALASPTAAG